MCTVYKARQVSRDRLVTVKMLVAGSPTNQWTRNPFSAEAAASLPHPKIVQVFEVGEFQGQPFCSTEWIEGKDLQQRLSDFCVPAPDSKGGADRRLIRQRQRKFADLLAKVARAVHFVHQHGILHLDLKPANILLDQEDEPHITNFFTLPKQREEDEIDDGGETCLTGTLAYMSPEQASGNIKQLTAATDIYSLGAILYHLLCCRPPHLPPRNPEMVEILRGIEEVEPVRPRMLNPRIDRDLEMISLICLEKNLQWRYPSAEALAEDLERWLRDSFSSWKWRRRGWLGRSWLRVRRTIRRTWAKADFFSRHAVKLAPQDAEVIKIRAEIVEAIKNPPKP